MFDYAGCIHFHSSYSYDAFQSVQRIVDSALRSGLDYALLTDHFNQEARRDGWERIHESGGKKLLLIVGEEVSPRYNHYLALNLRSSLVVSKTELHAQAVIDAVNAQGGFGFISHPDHPGAPFANHRAFPWVDWNVKGFAGLSIWDLMGDWIASLSTPWGMVRGLLCPTSVLKGPYPQTLNRWDELTQRFHCAAIGEIDNHGIRKRVLGIPRAYFSFDYAFRTVRTHVMLAQALSGQAEDDRAAVLSALRQGRSYVSFDLWNDPRGFCFEIYDGSQNAGMGEEIIRNGPLLVKVKIPSRGRIRFIRNGRVIREEAPRACLERDIDLPGVYRVEIDQRIRGRWRPWIFSNPIWVR